MKILFLDDNDRRCAQFKSNFPSADIVNSATEAIHMLQYNGPYDVICLDHDLGGEQWVDSGREDTGMEVVRHIIGKRFPTKAIIIHTHNHPAGGRMLMALVEHARHDVYRHPFGPVMLTITGQIIGRLEEEDGNKSKIVH